MGKFRAMLSCFDDTVGKLEMLFCRFLLVSMVIIVTISVILRYIFKSPMIAAMNIATLLLVWLTFFGASALYKEKGHIALVFIKEKFPEKIRRLVNMSVLVVITISLLITVVQTFQLMKVQWAQKIVAIGITRGILSVPVVIAMSLMIITTIKNILGELSQRQNEETGV
jgi:TRAP-type transport system small permease protein